MKPQRAVLAFFLFATIPFATTAAFAAGKDAPHAAAIASSHRLATQAGFEVLAKGGNAFDAAVAVGTVLAVVEPESSGIGGGGFFLLHRAADGKDVFVDARETAPAAADARDYRTPDGDLDKDHAQNGALSAAIPGEIAGFAHVAERYGKLPLAKSLAPAIRIARNGFALDKRLVEEIADRKSVMDRFAATRALYFPAGAVPKVGARFRNPDLARTLELVAAKGADGFYRGDFAQRLVDAVRAEGGRWSLEDLANYRVVEREPVSFDYRGWRIVSAPPPSSGGILIEEMLNVLGGYDLARLDRVHRVHFIVEAMRRAYRDRAQYLGDPDFVSMPLEQLGSPLYAAGLRASIHPDKATPSDLLAPPLPESEPAPNTSHFSIIDRDGNMVAATLSVNFVVGSGMVAPGTGFFLNDTMDDFALVAGKPNVYGVTGAAANALAPGKRPLSSMSPSFVIGADRVAVIGAKGGSRIITQVLEAILAFIDGEQPEKFVANPRYHHQYQPDVIWAEQGAFSADEVKSLEAMGHTLNVANAHWSQFFFTQAVSWDKTTGKLHAGADPRVATGSGMVK